MLLGAFLIPYVIMLTFVGLPTFFIELLIGQWSESGPGTVWDIAPLFKGKITHFSFEKCQVWNVEKETHIN